jgi:Cd2+/Zn2+-exporting ATPase
LRRFQFDANCMMVTAALGAVALGEYDEAASVAFLFAVSEFLEARATMKARKALSAIVNLRPDHANVVHPVSKEIIIVPADQVPLGSLISVKTGDKIAADGIVVDGSTAIDESSLTGEAKPSHKKVGDQVSGGTINIGASPLVIRTTTSVDDSAVARLIRLVEEAQSNRSPTEKMIDTFARSYTPSVMFMAILMCTIPWFWGPEVGRYWTLNGLIIVVIACPCALTISTPVTYAAGLAATAQRGIIVKGGAKLEAMGSVDRIVFDKTGTLTKGTFSVMHLEVVGTSKSREDMLQLLALMQERSSHPLSASLVEAAKKEGVNVPRHIAVTDHSILKGEGITAQVDGKPVYVGNERLFNRLAMLDKLSLNHQQLAKAWANTGGTVGFIGTFENGIIGMFCVKDTIREEAEAVIKGFKDAHIDVMMCTGDSNAAAHAVAREIGIPRGAVHSQLLPEDKLHFVGSLKRPQPKSFALCREKRYVLFCGDGVNDAPALAVADIGASMGEGAAMAMEMSDVTLMDSHLTKLSYTIKMGRRVLRTVKENICLSLLAKAGVVVATFMGKMTLLLAIAADVGIMLIVTLNGMKLLPSKVYDPMAFMEVTNLKRKKRRKKTAGTDDGDYEMTSPTSTEPVDTSFDAKDAKIV